MLDLTPLNIGTTKVIQVIVTQERVGSGTQDDPCRMIPQIFTLDGIMIVSKDPWNKEEGKFIQNMLD